MREVANGQAAMETSQLESQLLAARERYAQTGIWLDWAIVEVDPPAGVDLTDGLAFSAYSMTPEVAKLFLGLASNSMDDMEIFVVDAFDSPPSEQWAGYAYPQFSYWGNKAVNSVLINGSLSSLNMFSY